MQTVFRVKPRRKIQSQQKHPNEDTGSFRPRRAHKKSRLGCLNCKKRRVKCDENIDSGCLNCQRHGIECDYVTVSSGTSTAVVSRKNSPPSSATMCIGRPQTLLTQESNPNPKLCVSPGFVSPFDYSMPADTAPILQTLRFFDTFTCSTVTTIDGVSIFRDSILALSHHCNYLMHAILGMAAAHLRTMNGEMDDQQKCQHYSKTESYHWHHAIKQYRVELTKEVSPKQVDSLITTSMLLGLHSFQVDGWDKVSFVNAPEYERQAKLQWLVVAMGFPAVLRHVEEHIEDSVWFKLFNSSVPAEHGWTIDLEAVDGIFAAFLEVCDIDRDYDDEENPYKHALMDLSALFQIEQLSMRDMAQTMAFMSRLNGSFQGLLIALDSRALLILLYWLALLDKLRLWWAKSRTVREALAIIDRLEFDNDARIRGLVEMPKLVFANSLEIRKYG